MTDNESRSRFYAYLRAFPWRDGPVGEHLDNARRYGAMAPRPIRAVITGGNHEVRDADSPENRAILADLERAYNEHAGPRVGDYAVFPDGHEERICHDWGDVLQATDGRFGSSFNLGRGGWASFSGGLNPGVPIRKFERTPDTKPGAFWFFDRNMPRAYAAVYARIECRVYRIRED